jgi:hypothetical protein
MPQHVEVNQRPARWPMIFTSRLMASGTSYFFAGSSTGTWGDVLLTLTLPSGYWLLLSRASRIRMNFSASMMHLARNS